MIATRRALPRRLLWAFNLAGIGLLTNVVITAVLTMPTRFQVFVEGPGNRLVAGAPYIWLPAVLVAAAVFGHIALTRRLLTRSSG